MHSKRKRVTVYLRHYPRLHQCRLEKTATEKTVMHGNRKRIMVYLKILKIVN